MINQYEDEQKQVFGFAVFGTTLLSFATGGKSPKTGNVYTEKFLKE
jgi:hypothetical protein